MLPGDVTGDGRVNAADLVLTRNRIGRNVENPGGDAAAYSLFGDVNADGVINAADLVLVRNRIGTSIPATLRALPRLTFSATPIRAERASLSADLRLVGVL